MMGVDKGVDSLEHIYLPRDGPILLIKLIGYPVTVYPANVKGPVTDIEPKVRRKMTNCLFYIIIYRKQKQR